MERKPVIASYAAGSASRTFEKPAKAVGCHITAAAAFTIQIDSTGAKFSFAAGATTFYIPAESITNIKVEHDDASPSDTGVTACCWFVGKA